jgi:hypothetical protein
MAPVCQLIAAQIIIITAGENYFLSNEKAKN